MKLSILMPVYNERTMVERCVSQVLAAPIPENMERELVIVDDCSTDGTYAILERLAGEFPQIQLYRHERNGGKGAAVRTAIGKASGDFAIIQDADLNTIRPNIRACCVRCWTAAPTRFLARVTWPASRAGSCRSGTR